MDKSFTLKMSLGQRNKYGHQMLLTRMIHTICISLRKIKTVFSVSEYLQVRAQLVHSKQKRITFLEALQLTLLY
ncbi:hypothetical protein AOA60_21820 [Pseudomonas sp. 2822-17]|nr:hypothetical protein AOA60_21820 [Pseudomonas sp. 2822-17]